MEHFLQPTKLLQRWNCENYGERNHEGRKTDVEKARAIYEWLLTTRFEIRKHAAAGTGDIRFMLEIQRSWWECAD